MENKIFIVLLICHWLCDYTQLSTREMLSAKRFGEPLLPILEHASVHATMMGMALLFCSVKADKIPTLFLIQLISHFLIDTLKGKMNKWYVSLQNPVNVYHWWVFGLDQTMHILIILLMTNLAISL